METFLSTGVASSQQKESKIEELKGVIWTVKFYYNYYVIFSNYSCRVLVEYEMVDSQRGM